MCVNVCRRYPGGRFQATSFNEFGLRLAANYAFTTAVALLVAAVFQLPLLGRALPILPFIFPLYLFFVALLAFATASLLLIRARIEAS